MSNSGSTAASTSDSVSSPMKNRLPVNPRRHKVAPEQRKRVATACNSCNVRRIKCTGEKPCRTCRGANRDCVYPVIIEKVSVAKSELEDLRRKCSALETAFQVAVPDPTRRNDMLRLVDSSLVTGEASTYHQTSDDSLEEEKTGSGGRILHDPDGNARYLGETSGATFLDYLKEFMNTVFPLAMKRTWDPNSAPSTGTTFLESVGKYQTYDSRPLYEPEMKVNPLWLPSRADMANLLSELRVFIQDGNGSFPSGGIYWWGDLNSVPPVPSIDRITAASVPDLDKHRWLAFYQAAFAVACHANVVPTAPNFQPDGLMGESYFARARMLLGSPFDISRYTISDVAVLGLMGFYLIEMNRRDAAYMYVSVAMHISIMHGAHRGWVDERGKRVFWTLYILDRWLSCLMGRPPTILDDAIRLPLPFDAPTMPSAAGLRAHIELSRISGHIVCNTYRVAPWKQSDGAAIKHVDEAMHMLGQWLNTLPKTLQLSGDHLTEDPAVCTLHMAYNQLLLLTVRPIFFIAVKKSFASNYVSRRWAMESHPQLAHIRACSDAARRNLRLARRLLALRNRRLLQAPLHHIFNAAIILMLQELVCTNLGHTDIEDVLFTIDVFDAEARTGSNYARDCSRVLQDLRSLVTRLKIHPENHTRQLPSGGQQPMSAGPGGDGTPDSTAMDAVDRNNQVMTNGGVPDVDSNGNLIQSTEIQVQHRPQAQFNSVTPSCHPLSTEGMGSSAASNSPVTPVPSMPATGLPSSMAMSFPTGQQYASGSCGPMSHQYPVPLSEGDPLYQQLVTWMDYDDLQMYTNYLI